MNQIHGSLKMCWCEGKVIVTDRFSFGSKTIEYSIKWTGRRSLGISVTPSSSVIVRAPIGIPIELVRKKVRLKANWILEKQLLFREIARPQVIYNYTNGESHWYLGQQYRLKFIASDSISVFREDSFIFITGTRDPAKIEKALNLWYLEQATILIRELIQKWSVRIVNTHIELKFKIKKLKRRWGSCSSRGDLTFNLNLIKVSSLCVEYVVVHELCHLIEFNHGSRFKMLVTQNLPDWKERKAKLKKSEF